MGDKEIEIVEAAIKGILMCNEPVRNSGLLRVRRTLVRPDTGGIWEGW